MAANREVKHRGGGLVPSRFAVGAKSKEDHRATDDLRECLSKQGTVATGRASMLILLILASFPGSLKLHFWRRVLRRIT